MWDSNLYMHTCARAPKKKYQLCKGNINSFLLLNPKIDATLRQLHLVQKQLPLKNLGYHRHLTYLIPDFFLKTSNLENDPLYKEYDGKKCLESNDISNNLWKLSEDIEYFRSKLPQASDPTLETNHKQFGPHGSLSVSGEHRGK